MDGKAKLGLILGLLSAGTCLGFSIGRSTSPDASKPDTARCYLVVYGKWLRLDESKGRLTLRAGTRIYSYATGETKVNVTYLSAEEIAASPIPKHDFEHDFEKLTALAVAAPAEAGIVGAAVVMGKREFTSPQKAILAVATIGSGVIGYYLGHKSEPDYDNPTFEKELETNVNLWGQMEGSFRRSYHEAVDRAFANLLKVKFEQLRSAHPASKPIPDKNAPKTEESPQDAAARRFRENFQQLHPELKAQAENDPVLLLLKIRLAGETQ